MLNFNVREFKKPWTPDTRKCINLKLHLFILFFIGITAFACAGEIQSGSGEDILTGPDLLLNYHPKANQANTVDCFMYFIPLTSPATLTITTTPETTFSASITSWQATQKGNSVHVECDFEVTGQGDYSASYDPEEMIRNRLAEEGNPKEITKLLEWIRLGGPCLGRINGHGKIVNGTIQMESVEVSFNRDNSKSPVEVSMYDVPRKRGEFLFENRKNAQVARVNCLKFKRDKDGSPRMSVEIDSLKKKESKEGMFSRLTAMIANVLSTSTPIEPVGNTTMMNFGTALYKKQPVFTFPYAPNIKTNQLSKL